MGDALRNIHRAVGDIYDYCSDLPADGPLPLDLPLIARVVAAWQLEDPRQFSREFRQCLEVFCRLQCDEFNVLLPCLHETPDWHLSGALSKVLASTLASLNPNAEAIDVEEIRQQCCLMLTEVALDAAAYLPEAPLIAPPPRTELPGGRMVEPGRAASSSSQLRGTMCRGPGAENAKLPRPLQAADAEHPGVLKLCAWSATLWDAGSKCRLRAAASGELAVLCGALLISVPAATVARSDAWMIDAVAQLWEAVAKYLFDDSHELDPATRRLAVRLAGFALDRHATIANALLACAAASSQGVVHFDRVAAGDEDDEWAFVDSAAAGVVQRFLKEVPTSTEATGSAARCGGCGAVELDTFDAMD